MVENNNYSYRNKFYYFKLDDYNLYIALMSYSSMIKLSKKLIKNSRIMGIKLVEVKMEYEKTYNNSFRFYESFDNWIFVFTIMEI